MKKSLIIVLTFLCTLLSAQNVEIKGGKKYVEASELNLIGKIIDTPNPYHRVDTCRHKGFTKSENIKVRTSTGLAILFKTDSKFIGVRPQYGYRHETEATVGEASHGFDLYIKDAKGEWIFAGCKSEPKKKEFNLVSNMDGSLHECLLYLPVYSELHSLKIIVEEGAKIEALESPFRHRVGIFGSSYTHGVSCSRSGMSYPAQFTRNTGIQLLSLACSGNSLLQPYFAQVIADADVEAMIFDSFSNPDAAMIDERLFPFIEKIQEAHPDIPLIFMQTIRRENRNFDQVIEQKEQAKMDMAEKKMKEACQKYKNVYFVVPNASIPSHNATVDGVHPNDEGYTVWAKSIEKPILKILKKYGIK